MKKLILILIWLVSLQSGQLFTQTLPDSLQLAALETFRAEYGKGWIIRWDKETGVPTSVFGGETSAITKDPEKTARTFLLKNSGLFKIDIDLSKFQLTKVVKRSSKTYVKFRQMHQDIPVYGAEFILAVASEGNILSAGGRYYPVKFTLSISPDVSETGAFNIARTDFEQSIDLGLNQSELVILPYEGDFKLAWKLAVFTRRPSESWSYFIDAKNGQILFKQEVTMRITGTGKGNVYETFPAPDVDEEFSVTPNVDLPRMDASGYVKGTYADVKNPNGQREQEGNHDFTDLTANDAGFDEVNVYYHVDKFRNNFINGLGFNGFEWIEAIVNQPGGEAASFNFGRLNFYHSDPASPNFAREAKVIYHEYSHAVVFSINGLESPNNEAGAINEGLADYFAGSFVSNAIIGEYAFPSKKRNMVNPKKEYYSDFLDEEIYNAGSAQEGGEFFSHILWKLRVRIGATTNDQIVFDALNNVNSDVDFEDYRDKMMSETGNQTTRNTIQNTFAEHEVGDYANSPPAAPQNLTISGNLGGNPTLNWTAPNEPDISHYEVYRKKLSEQNFVKIALTSLTAYTDNTVTITGNFLNDDIAYHARTVDEEGLLSVPSNEVNMLDTYGGFKVSQPGFAGMEAENLVPTEFALHQNHPNPFNPETTLTFDLPAAAHVKLDVYNIRGQKIADLVDELKEAGRYNLQFDGSRLPSGIYLVQFTAGDVVKTNRMILLK